MTTSPPLSARLGAGPNNIDLLRLLGAFVVLQTHSFIMTGTTADEPTGAWFGRRTELGMLVVGMFFVFSGFLVSGAVQRSRLAGYLRNRALRLYPAFAAVMIVQTLVLGPLLTTLPVLDYLGDGGTWSALGRGLLLSPALGLPGVFADNTLPWAVNGSLWTLRFEAGFWVLLAVMAPLGLLRRGPITALAAGALACVVPAEAAGVKVAAIASYTAAFFAGSALYAWREVVPHRGWLAALAAVLLVLGCRTALAPVAIGVTLPYLVLYLGLSRAVVRLPDDLSYGAYLYAFPIQQTLVALLGPGMGPWGLTALAVPPTMLCALLSRRWVERPALRWKSARRGRRDGGAGSEPAAEPAREELAARV